MSILFRQSLKTAMFSRFLKMAIATSNFMIEVYNGGFARFDGKINCRSSLTFLLILKR